ncbi:Transcriptional regulatory protein sin3 [Tulasnella sp. 403]|nr:Transcriptional regulatory protein sin3 [Tulasnella sp. 403]
MEVDPPPPPPSTSGPTLPPITSKGHVQQEPPQTAVPPRPLHPEQGPPSARGDGGVSASAPIPANLAAAPATGLPRPSSAQPWPATALPPAPQTPANPLPPQEMIPAETPATPGGTIGDQSDGSPPGGAYRPLNVKDALSYLEMVKVKFNERPDVYNQFLDIMKDFKSQAIDTPGVIDRVSTLFTGHPTLIQGFNTFLPAGYRIDCTGVDGEENMNTITVTTPTGTHTQTADGVIQRTPRGHTQTPVPTPSGGHGNMYFAPGTGGGHQPPGTYGAAPHPGQPTSQPFNDPVPPPGELHPGSLGLPPQPPQNALSPAHHPIHSPHPTTPGVPNILGSMQHHPGASNAPSPQGVSQQAPASHIQDSKRPVEFNHAINYVNKIKNRFASDPDTYKQFLEILQTYQKEQRPIASVYEQVAILFDGSTDLLDEFKQFLPDTSQGMDGMSGVGLMGMIGQMASGSSHSKGDKGKDRRGASGATSGSLTAAADRAANGIDKAGSSSAKRKRREREPPPVPPMPTTSRQSAIPHSTSHTQPNGITGPSKTKRTKHHHNKAEPQSPPFHAAGSPSHRDVPLPHTDEAAFFERVKKFIDDRTIYHEFLKLLHLFTEEIIDIRTLIERAAGFLGGDGSELMALFKEVLGWDERAIVDGEMGPNGPITSNVRGTVSVVPTMERPKVDLNSCRKYGPSYRKLPKHEATLACSGRDAMCWEVLNDEWVSHPTWASEDAGFSTHKKNVYEDALHKSEEERHEYDFHIEAISRTISILEPLSTRINHMDAEERAAWKLKPGLGGQGKSIYQRIIKKVYGREHGLEVIQALHDSPSIAIPVILQRLKQKEEEWKRAQREWNKVWREVDARNFYKSLDHQGINFKVNDKKSINPKQLVQDIETKRREMEFERAKSIDPGFARTLPKYHFAFEINDVAVLQDCLKLVFSFLDRAPSNSSMAADARSVETFLRNFLPLFFCIDDEEFNAVFPPLPSQTSTSHANGITGDEVQESEPDDAMTVDEEPPATGGTASNSKKRRAGDLRKRVLKGAAAAGKKGASAGGGKKSGSSSRLASPAPPPPASTTLPGDAMQVDGDVDEKGKGKAPVPSSRLQDNIWIRHGPQDDADIALSNAAPRRSTPSSRKGTFFGNNAFYVLLRNLQLLYTRLHAAKKHAVELAATASPSSRSGSLPMGSPAEIPGQIEHRPITLPHAYLANPLAVSLGLADATGPGASRLIPSGPNPASQFYEHTLECCEQLFDGEMDQATFEDHLRFMFGIRAYHLFTVDKVVGSIIKQVQAVLSDVKNKELLTLLRRERTSSVPFTIQEQINARRTAEQMLGPDENMYRITWAGGEDWFYRERTRADEQALANKNTEREAERQERFRTWLDGRLDEAKGRGRAGVKMTDSKVATPVKEAVDLPGREGEGERPAVEDEAKPVRSEDVEMGVDA